MASANITRDFITRLGPVTSTTVYYDKKLKGFGVKVTPPSRRSPTGVRSFVVEYRVGAGGRRASKRRIVIGSADVLKAEEARSRARSMLAQVAAGSDPATDRRKARAELTIKELLTLYMADRIEHARKVSTARTYRGYVRNHLEPEFGAKAVSAVTKADVARLHRRIGTTHRTTANRVLECFAAAFAYGQAVGLVDEGLRSPAKGVERYPEEPKDKFLTSAELRRLGDTLRLAETDGLPWEPDRSKKIKHAPKAENRVVKVDTAAIAAIRLLCLTGARLREILNLRWSEVDLERATLFLPTSKTGRKAIVLGAAALQVLQGLPTAGEFVVPGAPKLVDGKIVVSPRADLNRPWARIRTHAALAGVRLHDLRHSFASVGVGSGHGLYVIGKLLGHAHTATTARYAHLADDPLRRASNDIAAAISLAMGVESGGKKDAA